MISLYACRDRAITVAKGSILFLGDLAVFATEESIRELFAPFGEILNVTIKLSPDKKVKLGYGFIQFSDHAAAVSALQQMNGVIHKGRAMRINWAQSKSANDSKHRRAASDLQILVSFIGKSPIKRSSVSEESLRSIFATYGPVVDATIKRLAMDHVTNYQTGYGFVHFANTPEGMHAAMHVVNNVRQAVFDGITFDCKSSESLKLIIQQQEQQQQQQQQQQYQEQQHQEGPSRPAATATTTAAATVGATIGGRGPLRTTGSPATRHAQFQSYNDSDQSSPPFPSFQQTPSGQAQIPQQSQPYQYQAQLHPQHEQMPFPTHSNPPAGFVPSYDGYYPPAASMYQQGRAVQSSPPWQQQQPQQQYQPPPQGYYLDNMYGPQSSSQGIPMNNSGCYEHAYYQGSPSNATASTANPATSASAAAVAGGYQSQHLYHQFHHAPHHQYQQQQQQQRRQQWVQMDAAGAHNALTAVHAPRRVLRDNHHHPTPEASTAACNSAEGGVAGDGAAKDGADEDGSDEQQCKP